MTNPPDTLVTPVEVHRARLRLTPVRSSGTLRFESGHVTFEGSDGRQRIRVPVDQVTDVVRHRSGFAFWATFAGRRCFVILRTRPRPGGFVAFYALMRPITTARYVWWTVRGRRRRRAATRQWLHVLTGYEPGAGAPDPATSAARGLHPVLHVPIRVALVAGIVLPVPVATVLAQAG